MPWHKSVHQVHWGERMFFCQVPFVFRATVTGESTAQKSAGHSNSAGVLWHLCRGDKASLLCPDQRTSLLVEIGAGDGYGLRMMELFVNLELMEAVEAELASVVNSELAVTAGCCNG